MPDAQPATTRVRHPLWFRRLTVRRVEALSPRVRRVILGGDDLEGFTTRSFDDHVKLFFPDAAGDLPDAIAGDTAISFPEGVARPQARDFTPRRFDPTRLELTIDLGLHAHGPATAWADATKPGSLICVRVEQIIFSRDWCEEHNAWADTAAQPRAAAERLVTITRSIQPFWLKFQAILGGDVQARFSGPSTSTTTNQVQMKSI
jgi:NADPH-dependent ferric siderophore reductase